MNSAENTTMGSVSDLINTTMAAVLAPTTDNNAKPMAPEKTIDQHLHFVMSAIVGPIICFPGMVGNILAIITWCRPGMKSSTGRYLTGQAVADFGVLLFFILVDSLQAWSPSIVYSVSYGVFFSYIGYPMLFFTVVCSIWFTVGVTVDRYIMVCWITKAKHYCNEKRANIGLLLIAVNSFIVNLPHFLSFSPVYPKADDSQNTNITNRTVSIKPTVTFALTSFGGGDGGKFYEFWIHCIILILIPWVTVLFMNIMIIQKIGKSNKKMADKKTRQSLKKSKQSENQITRLLLTVTFAFLFFIGLQCILQCLWMQKPPGANMMLVSAAFAFGKTGIVFNSAFNFPLYCMTGKRFRLELMKMLGLSSKDALLSSYSDHPSSGTSGTVSTSGGSSTTGI